MELVLRVLELVGIKFNVIKFIVLILLITGSDIGGSIRIPSHNVGIFGHKPTSGIVSLEGHFPHSMDKKFLKFLTIGPMCRYSKDLPSLTYLMCDENARAQLRLEQPIHTKDIDIYYLTTACVNSFSLWNVDTLIQRRILEAVSHFKSNGLNVKRLNPNCSDDDEDFIDLSDTLEISICSLCEVEDIPDLLSNDKTSVSGLLIEFKLQFRNDFYVVFNVKSQMDMEAEVDLLEFQSFAY